MNGEDMWPLFHTYNDLAEDAVRCGCGTPVNEYWHYRRWSYGEHWTGLLGLVFVITIILAVVSYVPPLSPVGQPHDPELIIPAGVWLSERQVPNSTNWYAVWGFIVSSPGCGSTEIQGGSCGGKFNLGGAIDVNETNTVILQGVSQDYRIWGWTFSNSVPGIGVQDSLDQINANGLHAGASYDLVVTTADDVGVHVTGAVTVAW